MVIKLYVIYKFGAIKNGLIGPTVSYHARYSLTELLPFPVVFNWGISINHQSAFFNSVYCTSNRRYPSHSVTIMMTLCSSQTSHTLKMNNTIWKQKHLPCNAANINNLYFSQEKKITICSSQHFEFMTSLATANLTKSQFVYDIWLVHTCPPDDV